MRVESTAAWRDHRWSATRTCREARVAQVRRRIASIADAPIAARSEARSKDKLRSGGKGAARLWQAPPETGWDEHDRLVKTDCGPHGGTLYVVAGSASQTGKGRINHKAMRYSTKSKGSALLSIMGNSKARIDFVNEGGEVEDVVELHKSGKGCLA